jgi:hypothetical protein
VLIWLATCLLLSSCQREIVREVVPGTVDVGGGNGVGGKPLGGWALKSVSELPEFKNVVQPILENLTKCFIPLAADMMHIAERRTWFMVPVALNEIPKTRLGAPFTTDQYAIQSYEEIWVNSKFYDAMKSEGRADLLLHELVVGVRILKDAHTVERCLAAVRVSALQGAKDSEIESANNECNAKYPRILKPPPIQFGQEDAAHIRRLEKDLKHSNGGQDRTRLKCGELKSHLKSTGLRDYDVM